MASVRLSKEAIGDLDEIWRYVAEQSQSLDVADKVIDKIEVAFSDILGNPQIGHLREDLAHKPVRFWSVYRYLIIYDPNADPVEIVRILHGARDVNAILD